MAVLYSNNASTTLSASITNSATSLTVAAGKGALFPAISGSDYFYITLVSASGVIEIMKVTARSADVFTVTRGHDGTTAVAWAAGDRVELRFNKALLDDVKASLVSAYPLADWNVANPNIPQLINTSTNGVNGVTNYMGMHFPHTSLNYGFQIAGRNDAAYFRTLENGTYTAWRSIAHSATQLYTFPVLDNNLNLDSGQVDKVWATNIGTATDRGTKPTNYAFVVNLGGRAASGLQVAASYGSSDNFYVRRGSDNGGSVNGANAWQPWYTLLHSGNYSSYAAAASHTHSYLPLSGGTLTGKVFAGASDGDSFEVRNDTASAASSGYITFKNKNSSGVYRPAARISGVHVDNAFDGDFLIETYSGGVAYKGLRVDENSNVLFYDTSGNTKFQWDAVNSRALIDGNLVLHAGNYTGYIGNYVSKSGDTMSSTVDGILTLNKSSGTAWNYINFSFAGTRRFYFGLNASYEPELGVDNGATFRVNGPMTVGGNAVLTASNFANYALPNPGSGTGGRVLVNLSGNPSWSDASFTYDPIMGQFRATNFRANVGDAAPTWNFNAILHAGNYTNYLGAYVLKSGDTMTGTLQLNSLSNSIIAQHDGTGAYWRGRIISRNSDAGRAVFLGNYNSKAGLFAHTNALDGWAPLYLNTLGDNGGSTVYLPHNATYTLDSGNNAYAILNAGNYTGFSGYLRAGGGNDGMDFNTLAYNTMYYAYISDSPNRPGNRGYSYGTILTFDPGQGTGGRAQFYVSHAGNDLIFRGGWGGNDSWQTWNRVLTDQNYTSYTGQYVLKSGDTMTGTLTVGRDVIVNGQTGGNYGNRIVVGASDTSYTMQDTNLRPTIQANGQYPVLSLNHTVTSNSNHGPTIQMTANGVGNQFVIGMTGNGSALDMGYSSISDWNPHNGIAGYSGTTFFRATSGGYIGIGAPGNWGPLGNGNPGYHLHFKGASTYNQGHAAVFENLTNAANNGGGVLFQNNNSNHSWGVVAEIRTVAGAGGADRPSLLFSTSHVNTSWSVGFVTGSDDTFRISKNHGHRAFYNGWADNNSGWGTAYFYITSSGVASANGGTLLSASNYSSYALPLSGGTLNGRTYQNDWFEFPLFTGLYSPQNAAHFFPNNGSYGSWRVQGTRNGWGGLNFTSTNNGDITLMVNPSSNETGFYNPVYGWQFRWMSGSLTVCKNTYGGGTEATVLDSSNYTNYTPVKVAGSGGYPHAGTGMFPFYNWGGSNGGGSAPTDNTYTIGISVGSHPSDQAYGFQIARNMWNTGLWTRGYDSGWGGWVRLLDSANYTDYVVPKSGGVTMTGNLSFSQPVGVYFANGQYIKDNSGGGLAIYSGAAINLTGTYLTYNGNTILTGANIGSYVVPSSNQAVGAIIYAFSDNTYFMVQGATVAGSTLVYPNSSAVYDTSNYTLRMSSNSFGDGAFTTGLSGDPTINITRSQRTSNVYGYSGPNGSGYSYLSGTWRLLSFVVGARYWTGSSPYYSYMYAGLWIRIA